MIPPLWKSRLLWLSIWIGLGLTGCSIHLKPQTDGPLSVPIDQQEPIQTQTVLPSAPAGPAVRFPEWPLPGPAPANQTNEPRAQTLPEPSAPDTPPKAPVALPAVPPPPAVTPNAPTKSANAKKPPAKPKPSQAVTVQRKLQNKQLTLSQLVRKYPSLLRLKGSGSSNQIALTFDDAPDTQYTPQVLDILKKYNVKATFFVVGQLAEKHPSIVKRMVKEGHVVGNHSYSHALLTKLPDDQYQSQIGRTQKTLLRTVGYEPRFFRPPYGEISESQLLWASSRHMVTVNWNVDSLDWKQLSRQEVTSNILNSAKPGSIILQHSGGGPNQNLSGTVQALPTVIESLQARGCRLVTLPELLGLSKQL